MPGIASLNAGQYYAHPHNQFWRIIGQIIGADPASAYEQRLQRLRDHHLALWDVLHSCVRRGSLDAAIDQRSARPNDLPALLREAGSIRRICCNGGTAYRILRRYFGAQLNDDFPHVELHQLPSTSAANASWTYARKLAAWSSALDIVQSSSVSRA
jgi:TDG/mug DNA glycosylase family protein